MKRRHKKNRGQNLVELVVVLPLLVLLILGILQFGLYWRTFQTVESVALEGSNIAATAIDDPDTVANEAKNAAINAMNTRLSAAGLPSVSISSVSINSGSEPNALYQSPAVAKANDVQIVINYTNPAANGVGVQVVYGYQPILAGTKIPLPGNAPVTIIPDFITVSSSQIQQYNTY